MSPVTLWCLPKGTTEAQVELFRAGVRRALEDPEHTLVTNETYWVLIAKGALVLGPEFTEAQLDNLRQELDKAWSDPKHVPVVVGDVQTTWIPRNPVEGLR